MKISMRELRSLIKEELADQKQLSDLKGKELQEFLETFEDYNTTYDKASPEMIRVIAKQFGVTI